MRNRHALTVLIVLLTSAALATAQEVSIEKNKLLSKRTAEADAYRKLAEAIYGLQINAHTYVSDFVAERDDIRTDVDSFVKGVRLGKPTWYSDGSCRVLAEVTVAKVVETLRRAYDSYYDGDSIKSTDFETITRRVEKTVIKAEGWGAPRSDLPPDLPIGTTALLTPAISNLPDPPIPGIWLQAGARARLTAIRAARGDAMRRLAERIKGLRLTSRTMVSDFALESDEIVTDLNTYLDSSGEETRVYLHNDELIAEVTLRLPTSKVVTTIKRLHSRHYRGGEIRSHEIEKITRTVIKRDFEATGMGVPKSRYLRPYMERVAVEVQIDVPDWSLDSIAAIGEGTDPDFASPQGRLRAARVAEVDAKRKLVEQIAGLRIRSQTHIRDFAAERDHIQTLIDGLVVDAAVGDPDFGEDSARVRVTIPGLRVWELVRVHMQRETRR